MQWRPLSTAARTHDAHISATYLLFSHLSLSPFLYLPSCLAEFVAWLMEGGFGFIGGRQYWQAFEIRDAIVSR